MHGPLTFDINLAIMAEIHPDQHESQVITMHRQAPFWELQVRLWNCQYVLTQRGGGLMKYRIELGFHPKKRCCTIMLHSQFVIANLKQFFLQKDF